jgi:hypothetical protein
MNGLAVQKPLKGSNKPENMFMQRYRKKESLIFLSEPSPPATCFCFCNPSKIDLLVIAHRCIKSEFARKIKEEKRKTHCRC